MLSLIKQAIGEILTDTRWSGMKILIPATFMVAEQSQYNTLTHSDPLLVFTDHSIQVFSQPITEVMFDREVGDERIVIMSSEFGLVPTTQDRMVIDGVLYLIREVRKCLVHGIGPEPDLTPGSELKFYRVHVIGVGLYDGNVVYVLGTEDGFGLATEDNEALEIG